MSYPFDASGRDPSTESLHSSRGGTRTPTLFPGSTGQTSEETPLGTGSSPYYGNSKKHANANEWDERDMDHYRRYGSSVGSFSDRNPFLSSRHHSLTESIANSVISFSNQAWAEMRRRRFLSVCIFSLLVLVIMQVLFMPRTSLDRDLRRLHGEYLTFDDATRLYLTHLTMKNNVEEYIEFHEDELHMPGDNYEATVDMLKDFKFKTTAEKYETWLSRPTDTYLRLYSPTNELVYEANLKESELFSFYPYSASGEAQAEYLFANYAREEDFQTMSDAGVTANGKILIIRNGKIHPSIQVHNAEQQGAKAVVIYSDPWDDGKFRSSQGYKEFPEGPARNSHAIQKETLNRILEQPGDPTTPGWSSTLFAKRIHPETIPKIPAIPISYSAVKPILEALDAGPVLGWEGDDGNFTYTPGVTKSTLQLGNRVQFKIKPIYNIVTKIPGVIADEEIIVGASRDVVGGIGGASSGFASLMEMARGFNELAKKGWKPLRTIKLISWDGTTYGMLGSTEFGEFYANRLNKNAIVYINLDGSKGSNFLLESNPIYNTLLTSSMKQIMWDEESTLYHHYRAQQGKPDISIPLISQRIGDYSVFQSHLGIPSVNVGFSNDKETDPVPYENSKFDSLEWVQMWDEDMHKHSIVAQFAGFFVLQLSEKEIIHIRSRDYLNTISDRFEKLASIVPESWQNRRVMMDPKKNTYDNPTVNKEIDNIRAKFTALQNVTANFDASLEKLQTEILQDYPWFKLYVKIGIAIRIKFASIKIRSLDKLFIADPAFTNSDMDEYKDGLLRGRKWFQHLIFAPDSKTGTTLELLPGITEGVMDKEIDIFTRNLAALDIALGRIYKKLK